MPQSKVYIYIQYQYIERSLHQINSPHIPPHQFSPRMVNFHDPVVEFWDFRAYAFAAKYMDLRSQLTSFDSGSIENLACCGWTVFVSLPHRALNSHNMSNNNNPVLISSWEFVTTLDFEWSVIRRHRPFGWSIWVRINALFLLGFVAQVRALD